MASMGAAVIVDAVRTAAGHATALCRDGIPWTWRPKRSRLSARNDLDPAVVDDVIMGCVTQVGAQSGNIGRLAVLGAGWPDSVPGTTIDRKCGSSLQAAHFAAQGVMAGAYDVVVAAGVEVMSLVPLGAATVVPAVGKPYGPAVTERYSSSGGLVPEGMAAEGVAQRYQLSREELDRFSVTSHANATRAAREGRFDAEILGGDREAPRPETGRLIIGRKRLAADEGGSRRDPR